MCRCIQEKNFDRHLNYHFDKTTREGRRQKRRVKEEASRRTVQGLREAKPHILPKVWRQALSKDTHVKQAFQQFLDDVGVLLPKQLDPQQTSDSKLPPEKGTEEKCDDDQSESEV